MCSGMLCGIHTHVKGLLKQSHEFRFTVDNLFMDAIHGLSVNRPNNWRVTHKLKIVNEMLMKDTKLEQTKKLFSWSQFIVKLSARAKSLTI